MKRIAVFTGTRAEYGLLRPLIRRIQSQPEFELQLLVSGMHLSPEFGMTVTEVEDEFPITRKVKIDLSSDTPAGICKSTGEGMIGLGQAVEELSPDLVVILGDRYEALAMATCAMLHRVPIAHLHGGELTEGAIDDSIRHAITKMSYLHFTSTEVYRQRVIQLGEQPERVFCVGAIGLDSLKSEDLMTRKELEHDLGIELKKFFLVTFHPATLDRAPASGQCRSLLDALAHFEDYSIVLTKANADAEGRSINQMLEAEVKKNRGRMVLSSNLGMKRYASAMSLASAVVGNSSSGILEAPYFGIPTVNVGDRQKNRIATKSVLNCEAVAESIRICLEKAKSVEFRKSLEGMKNPYGSGDATEKIMAILLKKLNQISVGKSFYDIRP